MDNRAIRNVIRIGIVGVFAATGAVLGNLVATMVPPSLVKTYPLPIIFSFIAFSIAAAWMAKDKGVIPQQQPSSPTRVQPMDGMTLPPWPTLAPTVARRPGWYRTFTRIATLVIVIVWATKLVSHLLPISHSPVPMVGPFPPRPSDSEALNLWNYARAHALHNRPGDFSASNAPISNSTDGPSSSPGCLLTGDLWSGYAACTSDNTQIQQFSGAFARWAVLPAPPDPQDRELAPQIVVGGSQGIVEAGTVSWCRGQPSVSIYLWSWGDWPNSPSYCLAKCPRLQPGDDVFVALYNIDDKTTAFLWENLTTGEYMYKTAPTPYRDPSSAAAWVGTPSPTSTYWKYGTVSFQGATLYGVGGDGTVISHPLGWYTVQKSTAPDPNGECIGALNGGSYQVSGGETC